MEARWLWNRVAEFIGTPSLAAAFVLFFFFFYFCPVNETKVMGRARLILLPYLPWRTDEWGKFLDRGGGGGANSSPWL